MFPATTSQLTVGNPVVPDGVYRYSSCCTKLMAHLSLTLSPASPPHNFCLTLLCLISTLPWPLTLRSICCRALVVTFLPSATLPLSDPFVACEEIKPRHFYWTSERSCVSFYLFFISTFKHAHVQNVVFQPCHRTSSLASYNYLWQFKTTAVLQSFTLHEHLTLFILVFCIFSWCSGLMFIVSSQCLYISV